MTKANSENIANALSMTTIGARHFFAMLWPEITILLMLVPSFFLMFDAFGLVRPGGGEAPLWEYVVVGVWDAILVWPAFVRGYRENCGRLGVWGVFCNVCKFLMRAVCLVCLAILFTLLVVGFIVSFVAAWRWFLFDDIPTAGMQKMVLFALPAYLMIGFSVFLLASYKKGLEVQKYGLEEKGG